MEPLNNMKKLGLYVGTSLLILVALYNSIYIDNLQSRRNSLEVGQFNPDQFIKEDFFPDLQTQPTLEANQLLDSLALDFKGFSERQGKKLGISDDYYFLISGTGRVVNTLEEDILLEISGGKGYRIRLATDFIFGNTLRDASGLVDIGEYQNTMDFNEISIALNAYIKETILPPFKQHIGEGDVVKFKGGAKVSIRSKDLSAMRVIPFHLAIE